MMIGLEALNSLLYEEQSLKVSSWKNVKKWRTDCRIHSRYSCAKYVSDWRGT